MKTERWIKVGLGAVLIQFAGMVFGVESIKQVGAIEISPGRGIGGVMVGERLGVVERKLGRSSDNDTSMGRLTEIWHLEPEGVLEVHANRPDEHTFRVQRIRTTSGRYRTGEGLHVGSKLSEIRKVFPNTQFEGENLSRSGVVVLLAKARGIRFEFSARNAAAACVAVEVFLP